MTNLQFLSIMGILYVLLIHSWKTDLQPSILVFRFLLLMAVGVFMGLALRGS